MFEPKPFAEIFESMRSRTPDSLTDFQEGSVVRTVYESFAYEMALLYEQMYRVYLSAYVDTAQGSQLDLVVAVLGIKRGEPDFATGMVTFTRDIGMKEDIEIPIGTLVTTAETKESPKKVYKTIEVKAIPKNQKSVQVRVLAVQRGEKQAVEKVGEINVMPQPVPGVKSVTNEEAIIFAGKQWETDEQLHNRAKKALLASSGANNTAIENALLNLPGVTQVQVRENFHYARGEVMLTSKEISDKITISKGTKLQLAKGNVSFATTEEVTLSNNESKTVSVQALVRGEAGQVIAGEQWQEEEKFTVSNADNLVMKDFGIIEVFVDGIDFNDINKVSELKQEVDRVKAAGIYVLLKPAHSVIVDGIFQIELAAGLKLSVTESEKLEEQVKKAIADYIRAQKMGQPLLISQMTRKILEINGVSDLVNFSLATSQDIERRVPSKIYKSSEKSIARLEVDVFEKFVPREILVAFGTPVLRPLPVDIKVEVKGLKSDGKEAISLAIQEYFNSIRPGQWVEKSAIKNQISTFVAEEFTIEIIPNFLQPNTTFNNEEFEVKIVEQIQLGTVLIIEMPLPS